MPLSGDDFGAGYERDCTFVVSVSGGANGELLVGSDDWRAYELRVECAPRRATPQPKLLRRYLQLLGDETLPVAVVEAAIRAARLLTLNDAKLLFQLSRQREQIDLDSVVQVLRYGAEVRERKLWRWICKLECVQVCASNPTLANFAFEQENLSKH